MEGLRRTIHVARLERILLMLMRSQHDGKIEGILIVYGSEERADSAPESWNGALGGFSQKGFKFAEDLLDRIEIGRSGSKPRQDIPGARR